jgi:hypothetical protein
VKTLACITRFCCKSGSNSKTQPCYWLATNNTRREQKPERHNRIDKTHRKRTSGKNKDQRKKEQEKGFAVPWMILERYLVGSAVQHHHTEPAF